MYCVRSASVRLPTAGKLTPPAPPRQRGAKAPHAGHRLNPSRRALRRKSARLLRTPNGKRDFCRFAIFRHQNAMHAASHLMRSELRPLPSVPLLGHWPRSRKTRDQRPERASTAALHRQPRRVTAPPHHGSAAPRRLDAIAFAQDASHTAAALQGYRRHRRPSFRHIASEVRRSDCPPPGS